MAAPMGLDSDSAPVDGPADTEASKPTTIVGTDVVTADSTGAECSFTASSQMNLRLHGAQLLSACNDCLGEVQAAHDFDAKFLVLDKWLRIFDGEPLYGLPASQGTSEASGDCVHTANVDEQPNPDPKVPAAESGTKDVDLGSCSDACGPSSVVADDINSQPNSDPKVPAAESGTKDVVLASCSDVCRPSSVGAGDINSQGRERDEQDVRPTANVEVKRFAKYKRLKEAAALYHQHFGENQNAFFDNLVPKLLQSAATLARCSRDLPGEAVASATGRCIHISAAEVRALLANMILLNVRGFADLQRLYVSSAKAAPQKLLCLLSLFRSEEQAEDRLLKFERCVISSPSLSLHCVEPSPLLSSVQTTFVSNFGEAADGASAALLMLSGPGTCGSVADVKTPPEEIILWEMPELLCIQPLLGGSPLACDEVCITRCARRVNRCVVEGPLLRRVGEAPATELEVAFIDIARHIDDQRFALSTLARDGAKWAAGFQALRIDKGVVAVTHPPLFGLDQHWAFAMQWLCASMRCSQGLTLRYALTAECSTGDGVVSLTPLQTKQAKHFEALASRMRQTSWTARDVLGLLAWFPFGRKSVDDRFHAYWTHRLRDKESTSAGRVLDSDLESLQSRQHELLPLPASPPDPPVDAAPSQQQTIISSRNRTRSPKRRQDRPVETSRPGRYGDPNSRSRTRRRRNDSRSPSRKWHRSPPPERGRWRTR